MLVRLLRTYLRPYTRPLLAVVALQLVGTMASLYLPSLNADIIDNGVADPTLTLFDPNGMQIGFNDNWQDSQKDDILATNLQPTNNLESAILMTLPSGSYTAIVQGKNNATIARSLFLTERAVEKHINSLFHKLGLSEETEVHRRVMAVLTLLREGGLPPPDAG